MSGRISAANIKKTLYYVRRNGIRAAYYAARERMEAGYYEDYVYNGPSAKELKRQREAVWENSPLISILVPAFHTPEPFLRALVDSVVQQSYTHWELLIADASGDDNVKRVVQEYPDERICYIRLSSNEGISENTNQALEKARGSYIGLLDHDDLLTPDALYEIVCRIEEGRQKGRRISLIYSDEDKCDQSGTCFYDPHFKEDFNLDLLLSNNYICHFMVLESGLLRKLRFRKSCEGAQDYDVALRAAGELMDRSCMPPVEADESKSEDKNEISEKNGKIEPEASIRHIQKVLYHWRCHTGSTAENPRSKEYAYEAGAGALQDFIRQRGWKAQVCPLKHVGFYGIEYEGSVLEIRKDIGAVGGRLLADRKITGGIYRSDGSILYEGIHEKYSGYMHRAALCQDADAVDIRCIQVREECHQLFLRITGFPYEKYPGEEIFDYRTLPIGTDYESLSLMLGNALRQAGYRVLWDPRICVQADRKAGQWKK